MNGNIQKLAKILGENRVIYSEILSKYSSFHIGGEADLFYRAKSVQELATAVNSARQLSVPVFVLGGGTNLLISDLGFRGLVVKNDTSSIKLLGIKGKKEGNLKVYLEVESGVSINRLVRYSLDQGLSGLEYFLGQPGTVGGAVYINAHNMRKGVYMGEKIMEAKILKQNGLTVAVSADYFHFGYDHSIIQNTNEIVLSVIVELKRGDKDKLWSEAQETLEYRHKTQPTGVFSSGCTFRNISKSDAMRLANPNYTTSAGFLLDCLNLKGFKKGEAMFSQHHANFIVHKGGAKASDVLELINIAKKRVKEKYNITLQEEIVKVGEF